MELEFTAQFDADRRNLTQILFKKHSQIDFSLPKKFIKFGHVISMLDLHSFIESIQLQQCMKSGHDISVGDRIAVFGSSHILAWSCA